MTLQHRVQDVLDELVATGAETGLQVAGDRRSVRRVVTALGRLTGPDPHAWERSA
jgi:hypothetical protein